MTFATNHANHMVIGSAGVIKFNTYGSGTHTGTLAKTLGVDSSGNIIEVDAASGGVDGSGTANYISKWSATWHHSHLYSPDVAPLIPAGAVIILKQWYDNTAANPNNPDPDMFVMGGSRTGDEMTHAWLAITHLDDEGFKQLKAQRMIAGND